MLYYGTRDWYIFIDTLRKIRNDQVAAELDTRAVDFDLALQRAEWRERSATVHAS